MRSSAIIFLFVVTFLASIAFSAPTSYDYCKDSGIKFDKPMNGDIYKVNSTHVVEFEILKDCYGMH